MNEFNKKNQITTSNLAPSIQEIQSPTIPSLPEQNSEKLSENVEMVQEHLAKDKLIVKVYGLIGYTKYIDLEFERDYLLPENTFIFEGKRYKIASVIEMNSEEFVINAVSVEYSS